MNRVLLFTLMSGLAISCGKKKDEEESDSSLGIPSISFSIPTPNGSALVASTDVLTNYQERTNNVITRLNSEIERLNLVLTKLEGEGSFTGKGPDGNVSGTVAKADDGVHDYQATICVNSKVFTQTLWKSDGTKVTSSRDLNNAPLADNQRDLLAKVTYEKSDSETLVMQLYGDTYQTPPTGVDGSYLTEYFSATKSSAGDFSLTGVNDWSETKASTFSGDGYIVGKLDSSGNGEFVAHAKRLSSQDAACGEALNESSPTWCHGRAIGASSRYTADEKAAAWERLKVIGLTSKSVLGVVTVSGVCP